MTPRTLINKLELLLHQQKQIQELEADLLYLREEYKKDAANLMAEVEHEQPELLDKTFPICSFTKGAVLHKDWDSKLPNPISFVDLTVK